MSRATGALDLRIATSFHASANLTAAEEQYPFTPADLESHATQLRIMRGRLAQEIAQLQHWASFTPVEGVDSDVEWDHRMAARSVDDKRSLLREVDQALTRIADNTFGLCTIDSQAIPRERLAEMPWVDRCEYCATHPRPGMPMDAFGVIFRASAPVGDLAD